MRLLKPDSGKCAGSVLMVTLFSAVLIGTVLASYLTLIRHQSAAVARSQGWNAALALAEAGVEEALAQINSGTPSANGWGPANANPSDLKKRQLPLMNGGYDVKFFVTTTNQTIFSTGYVTIPATSIKVARAVKVTTRVAPVINTGSIAVGSRSSITYSNGTGGLATDSFDSADPANKGRYPISDPSRQLTNGDVATLSGPISLGNSANNFVVKGDLLLGPTASASANTVYGETRKDFNSDYPDIDAPAGWSSWLPAVADTPGGKITFTSGGSYIVSDGNAQIIVRAGADVTLYVTATNFKPNGITVETNSFGSGKLKIYQQSGSAILPGSGKTSVQSERAENLQYFGLSGVSSVTYEGAYNFFGVIYAPSASLFLNNGWNSPPYNWGSRMNFVGAAVGKSILMYGFYTFHFDENLLRPGVTGGGSMTSVSYVASTWAEQPVQ